MVGNFREDQIFIDFKELSYTQNVTEFFAVYLRKWLEYVFLKM